VDFVRFLFWVVFPCHDRLMQPDSYWRTRTVGEAQAHGYSHLRATCASCGRITDLPWKLLLGGPRVTPDTFIGNIPLRCQRCGHNEPIIGVRHLNSVPRTPTAELDLIGNGAACG